jgi:gamma-glutamyl:cysteine ligase YbdK (ATP-grasp superfamily)
MRRHWPLVALVLASALWGGAITGTISHRRGSEPDLPPAGAPERLTHDAYASETTGA